MSDRPDLDAFEAADWLLRGPASVHISPLGLKWRLRAADRLAASVEKELRDGRPVVTTEAVALALLKETARDLRGAARALEEAAKRLREKGDGLGANRAYTAGRAVAAAADGIDPP